MLHNGICISVASANEETAIDLVFGFELNALCTECFGVDIGAELKGCQFVRRNSQFGQPALGNEFNSVRELIVEVGHSDPRPAI